jgi:hypothetical protein
MVLALSRVAMNSNSPGLVAARSAEAVPAAIHHQGALDTVLAPYVEADHNPIQVDRPCVVVAVLDIETCLGLVEDAANSTEDRSDSAVVQSKGLWERRCQISLHLRLMHDVRNLHRLSGIQTDLMVVPYFLPHRDAEVVPEDIGCNAQRTRLDNAQVVVQHRNQTVVCSCWLIAGRFEKCRSRQKNALLFVFTQKMFFNVLTGTQAANLTARILLHPGPYKSPSQTWLCC